MRQPVLHFQLSTLLFALLLSACTNDPYDSGDGRYSYLHAEFAEAHTIAAKTFDRATTDDGENLRFDPYATAEWAEKADTIYRALLYYNKAEHTTVAEPVSAVWVPVLSPIPADKIEREKKFDPVTLESLWTSANGRYVNLALLLKTGKADDPEAVQSIGIMKEEADDGLLTLRVLHDQGSVPEYYTSRIFISIPVTDDLAGRSIRLIVNTYKGIVEKTIALSH